jgi:cytochrome c oxidase subunit 2
MMRRCVSGLFICGVARAQQSALDAVGPQSAKIASLLWFFFGLLAVIFILVIGVTLWSLTRRHRGIHQEPLEGTHRPSEATDSGLRRATIAATVVTTLILFGLLIASVSTGSAIANRPSRANPLLIEVTGNQWWWQVRYTSEDASRILVTANEIHIPVGRPVQIKGTSHDVIHSFWAPNLQGKVDLIPSRVTSEWIQADRPGYYRGQCAEFCGLQHAHMAFWIVAQSQNDFDQWMEQQLQPSAAPTDENLQHGQQVFLGTSCVLCHTIRGTNAAGQVGPDLTHIGSRLTIAAGTLPNTKGNLGGWITDPQTVKPGNHMATTQIPSQDLQPLLDYLESLR